MKKILLSVTVISALSACAAPQTNVPVQLPQQTPQQVVKTFCDQATVVTGDLKLLTDLTPQDQLTIGKISSGVTDFCTTAEAPGTTPDLVAINTQVTQMALTALSNSTIANKDKYEIGLIVAQSIVTQYLSQVQAAQSAKPAVPASAASGV